MATVFWSYAPPNGTIFAPINIGLGQPSGIFNNPGSLSAHELLARSRFLYFYNYANPVIPGTRWDLYVDDIQLGAQLLVPVKFSSFSAE